MRGESVYSLAVETSGRRGGVTLGRGDQVLASVVLPEGRRHNLALMPAVAQICRDCGVTPDQLAEVYVSSGPGSFTGLRMAMASAKMLAMASGCKLVAVPTLAVLAHNAPQDATCVAVGLNFKRDTVYGAWYVRRDAAWHAAAPPGLVAWQTLLSSVPAGHTHAVVIADPLPEVPADHAITRLPVDSAVARSEVVWRLGRAMAKDQQWTAPQALSPNYVREPEAVTLWNERHGPPN